MQIIQVRQSNKSEEQYIIQGNHKTCGALQILQEKKIKLQGKRKKKKYHKYTPGRVEKKIRYIFYLGFVGGGRVVTSDSA